MATVFICAILIILSFLALRSTRKRLKSGCCGIDEKTVRKIKVHDRNLNHYPFETVLEIDGMTCKNCATHIENKLNSVPGVYAKVNLDKREAVVHMQQNLPEDVLFDAVSAAGYTVMKIIGKNRTAERIPHNNSVQSHKV
jgi:copper chaperone CopZ